MSADLQTGFSLMSPPKWGKRGQSLVEVAISLPFVLLLTLGVTDIGRAFYFREGVINATRQAIRIAASPAQQATGNAVCAGAVGARTVVATSSIPPPAGNAIYSIANAVALESSSNGTAAGSVVNGATLTVTFHCDSSGGVVTNTSNGGVTDPANANSDAITAKISYALAVITPFADTLLGPKLTISNQYTGRSDY